MGLTIAVKYVIRGGVEGTDYSFVPSSLGERCFGFDAAIVIIAVGLLFEGTIRMLIFVLAFAM